MGLAIIDRASALLHYSAVGNTRAILASQQVQRLPSDYGIVGDGIRRLSVETASYHTGDTLLLFTDGFDENVSLSKEQLLHYTLEHLQSTIVSRWDRGRDDAGLLIVRGE